MSHYYQFDTSKMPEHLKKEAFKNQMKFANKVVDNHKGYHELIIGEMEDFGEAYDASEEFFNMMVYGIFLASTRKLSKKQIEEGKTGKFEKHQMQYKCSMSLNRTDNDSYKMVFSYKGK